MSRSRQIFSLVGALGLTIGGLYWLSTIFFSFEDGGHFIGSRTGFTIVTVVPVTMVMFGMLWTWEDLKRW
jgi:hypothetical protein